MLPEPFTSQFLSQLETLRLRTRKEFLGSHTGNYSSPQKGTAWSSPIIGDTPRGMIFATSIGDSTRALTGYI
jgi:hypothetical protein